MIRSSVQLIIILYRFEPCGTPDNTSFIITKHIITQECHGEGESVDPKLRCKKCNGKKVNRERKILEVSDNFDLIAIIFTKL